MQIISWNVDGLDKELLPPRHLNLISTISQFDVIFLQEVVGETWDIVKTQLVDYEHLIGKTIDWVSQLEKPENFEFCWQIKITLNLIFFGSPALV